MNTGLDKRIRSYESDIVSSTRRLLKIRSVRDSPAPGAPFGFGINTCLQEALLIARELGFATKNLDGYCGYVNYGQTGKLFGVLGHLDVVPEGNGWSGDPYGGEIRDGCIWGRGAIDNKGPMVAVLYALKAVLDSGIVFNNRIRIVFGTDEETSWSGVKHYIEREEIPEMSVTPDAAFPIIHAEKGIVNYSISCEVNQVSGSVYLENLKGGLASNMVPQECEAVLQGAISNGLLSYLSSFRPANGAEVIHEHSIDKGARILIRGVSAHGGDPGAGVNAISAMVDLLSGITELDNVLKERVRQLSYIIGYETSGKGLGISGRDEITGDLTVNFGILSLEKNELKCTLNVRYPVFFNEERILSILRDKIMPFKLRKDQHFKPLYVSPHSELIKVLSEVYEEVTGKPASLLTMAGGSYARAFPNAVAFGNLFPGRISSGHKPDEHIMIEDLVNTARIYAQLFARVATDI